MRRLIPIFFFLFSMLPCVVSAQDSTKHFFARGYLKDLNSLTTDTAGDFRLDRLFHHRLNLLWKPDSSFSAGIEFRNRLFMGSSVQNDEHFAEQLDPPGLLTPLSVHAQTHAVAFHGMADRAWIQYAKKSWEVRLGRQRIHWGMSYLWNPLDWYNAWSYFDFDYEERPGSDALRIRKYTGATSRAEAAFKFTRDMKQSVFAAQYLFNLKQTTLQVQAGKVGQDLAAGAGWNASVKQWGIKGEAAGFFPLQQGDSAAVSLTLSAERLLGAKGTLLASVLYNSDSPARLRDGSLDLLVQSARRISPVETTVFVQAGYTPSPLCKLSLAGVAGPADGTFVLIPSVDLSLSNRLELLILSQMVWGNAGEGYGSLYQGHFLRLKWSY